jgi:hypothetical protein
MPEEGSWNLDGLRNNGLLRDPFEEACKSYFEDLKNLSFHRFVEFINMQVNIRKDAFLFLFTIAASFFNYFFSLK